MLFRWINNSQEYIGAVTIMIAEYLHSMNHQAHGVF